MNKREAKRAVKLARRDWVRPLVYGGVGHIVAACFSILIVATFVFMAEDVGAGLRAAILIHFTVAILVNAIYYAPQIREGMQRVDALKLKVRSVR